MIEIKNLNKTFKKHSRRKDTLRGLVTHLFNEGVVDTFEALKNISFKVEKGDFVGIIGKNGSGKSTLLKIIAGIYSADIGSEIKVSGSIVPFLELGVGFNMELTGRENIYLNGTLLGMTKRFLDSVFDKIVEFAELQNFIDEPVKNYSSGMIVRLAFSIAIQAEADIYILDEILAVGDGIFQQKSKDVITQMIEDGKTILFVSHDLGSVKTYSNKVLWIEKGEMKYFGDVTTGINLYQQEMFRKEKEEIENSKETFEIGTMEVKVGKTSASYNSNNKEIIIESEIEKQYTYKEGKKINIDFGIFSDDWKLVHAFRTGDGGSPFPKDKNKVIAKIKDVNLLPGKYYINIALYNKDNTNPYHWKRQAAVFVINPITEIAKFNYTGFVYFNNEVEYKE